MLQDSGQCGKSGTPQLQQETQGISPNYQGCKGIPLLWGLRVLCSPQVWLLLLKRPKQPNPTPNELPRQDDGAGW